VVSKHVTTDEIVDLLPEPLIFDILIYFQNKSTLSYELDDRDPKIVQGHTNKSTLNTHCMLESAKTE
jgi:hypothetical protein